MTSRANTSRPGEPADRPKQGRFDPARFGRLNPDDKEPRPEVAPEDIEATRAELEDLKRRTRRKSA
jgi:hypothetical protein